MSAAQPGDQLSVNAGIHGEPTANCNDSLKDETRVGSIHRLTTAVRNPDPRRAEATTGRTRRCSRLSTSVIFIVIGYSPARKKAGGRGGRDTASARRAAAAKRACAMALCKYLGRCWKRSSVDGNIRLYLRTTNSATDHENCRDTAAVSGDQSFVKALLLSSDNGSRTRWAQAASLDLRRDLKWARISESFESLARTSSKVESEPCEVE